MDLHAVGLLLLVFIYRRGENDTQGLFLINLASTELLWNLVAIASDISYLFSKADGDRTIVYETVLLASKVNGDNGRPLNSVDLALITGISYNVILAMFYYTGDRLLHMLLHARYEEYWNTRKTKIIILVTWVSNVLMSSVFAVLYYFRYLNTDFF